MNATITIQADQMDKLAGRLKTALKKEIDMGKGGGRKGSKKDKWEGLAEEFKAKIDGSKDDLIINEEIKNAALYRVRMEELEAADQDLANAKEASKTAGAVYKEAKDACKLKIAYCRAVLKSRGRKLPGE